MKKFFILYPGFGLVHGRLVDEVLKAHLEELNGLTITQFVPEVFTEAMICFKYKGYEFDVDNSYGPWHFWVTGDCPAEILNEIIYHCDGFDKKEAC